MTAPIFTVEPENIDLWNGSSRPTSSWEKLSGAPAPLHPALRSLHAPLTIASTALIPRRPNRNVSCEMNWPFPWPSLFAIPLLLLSSCRPSNNSAISDPDVLVLVGQTPIRRSELDAAAGRRGISDPTSLTNLLEELIDREITLQSAQKEGFDQRPDIVDFLKETVANRYLEQGPGAVPPPVISESQARDFRDRNPRLFQREPRWRVAQFQLEVPRSAGDVARGLASTRFREIETETRQRVPPAKGFGALSERSKDPATRSRGGDIGWMTRSELTRSFPALSAAWTNPVAVGTVFGPLENGDLWEAFRLTAFEPGGPRPWNEVRQLAEHYARQESIANAALARRSSLRQGISIVRPNR